MVERKNGTPKNCFIFGLGYTGMRLANQLIGDGWTVAGTMRTLKDPGCTEIQVYQYPFCKATREYYIHMLQDANYLLFSAPVDPNTKTDPFFGDSILRSVLIEKAESGDIAWAGYLSTTSVYGDTKGEWVDEETEVNPSLERGMMRWNAEQNWLYDTGLPMHIFRLPGIYGPGRGSMSRARTGAAKCLVKENHVFSRIHVDDIVGALRASMEEPFPGRIYNVVDDQPEANHIVTEYAYKLLGKQPPPRETFDEELLSPLARSFYQDCRRVRNTRLKHELGYVLRYPSYIEGFKAQLAEELSEGWTIIDDLQIPNSPKPGSPRRTIVTKSSSPRKIALKSHPPQNSLINQYIWRPLVQLFSLWRHWIASWMIRLLRRRPSKVFLIDNGSLSPAPHLILRGYARRLEERLQIPCLAASIAHSDKIDAMLLKDEPALVIRDIEPQNCVAIPCFLGPSASIRRIEKITQRIAKPLGTAAVAESLLRNIEVVIKDNKLSNPHILVVDHGSADAAMTQFRRGVTARIRRRLGRSVRGVLDASMEALDGSRGLAWVMDRGCLGGEVVVAMAFLFPGKHAGPDGDVARILGGAAGLYPTRLIGEDEDFVLDILVTRYEELLLDEQRWIW